MFEAARPHTRMGSKPFSLKRRHTLFDMFLRLEDFNCGEGIIFNNIPFWITARRKAYNEFRNKFSQGKLVSWEQLSEDYRQFLYFKYNLSWTTLYRSGLQSLVDIERLWKLLTLFRMKLSM